MVVELEALAAQLPGHLEVSRLCRKYVWMKPIFGWNVAKWAQTALPQAKASCFRQCDKAIFRLGARGERPRTSGQEHCDSTKS